MQNFCLNTLIFNNLAGFSLIFISSLIKHTHVDLTNEEEIYTRILNWKEKCFKIRKSTVKILPTIDKEMFCRTVR